MTQTGTMRIDCTTAEFREATKTGWSHLLDSTEPALFDVTFAQAFSKPPCVLVSITGIDAVPQSTVSFALDTSSISASGFKIELTPKWGMSIRSITISWLATDA